MSLENQIHELRKRNNMSQEQLAEKMGVARQTISKWELGETSPDIKQAQGLALIFNVTLDELLGSTKESRADVTHEASNSAVCKKNSSVPWKKVVTLVAIIFCTILIIFGTLTIINRTHIIHPEILSETIVINRKGQAQIKKSDTGVIVFREEGKPAVACRLPERFIADDKVRGLYSDGHGNFISFNADYEASIVNPLLGTEYYSYYADHGYDSYLDMVRLAMYYDPPRAGIFSSNEEIYLAGGAQLIRQQFCAGKNADYYELGSGLTSKGDKMLICGFALRFDDSVWLVTLKDYTDNYYYITVNDPDGVGESIDSLVEFLSSVYAGNATQYFAAKDSAAIQSAMNAYKEYYAIDLSDDGKVSYEYFFFNAGDDRFVAIHNGSSRVFNNLPDALDSMIEDPSLDRLHKTCVDGLLAYK